MKSFKNSIIFPRNEVDFRSVIPHLLLRYLNKFSLLFIRREHKKTKIEKIDDIKYGMTYSFDPCLLCLENLFCIISEEEDLHCWCLFPIYYLL